MSEPNKSVTSDSPLAGLESWLRTLIREEIQAANQNGHQANLLTAEQLAERLQVHKNWVYEQSRQGNIPTIRVGRHIRFSLHEVLTHQRQNGRS